MRIERNNGRLSSYLPAVLRPGDAIDAPRRQSRPTAPWPRVETDVQGRGAGAGQPGGWTTSLRTTGAVASSAWIAQLLAQNGAAASPPDAPAPASAAGAYRKTQNLTVAILGPHASDATPRDLRV